MNKNTLELIITSMRGMFTRLGDNSDPRSQAHFLGLFFRAVGDLGAQTEEHYRKIQNILARNGMDHELARWNQSLGRLYWMTGRYPESEEATQSAKELFARLGPDPESAMCSHHLGLVYACTGRYSMAEQAYREAREIFTRLGMDRMLATCEQNLGTVFLDTDRITEAEQAFRTARETYAHLGLIEHVARCDVSQALTRRRKAHMVKARTRRLVLVTEALELLVPAVLMLDAVRFRLPSSTTRAAWTATITGGIRIAFELAAELGGAQLIAELVEVSLNVGVHTVSGSRSTCTSGHSPDDRVEMAALPLGLTEPAQSDCPDSWISGMKPDRHDNKVEVGLAAGVSPLVAGAALPLAAPPRLRMPDGRIALGHYLDRAEALYGTTGRSEQIVDTW